MKDQTSLSSTDELDFLARYYSLGPTDGRWHQRESWWQIETDKGHYALWFYDQQPAMPTTKPR